MSSTSAWLKRILRGTKFIKIRIQGNELDQDPLGWSRRMVSYHRGEFSMAAVQANRDMEDLSQVEVGRNALFVGIYDGLVGDTTSTYISNHLFPTLLRLIELNNNNMSTEILKQVIVDTEAGFIEFARNNYQQHRNPLISVVNSGCLICVIWKDTLFVANVGDSRVILGSHKGKFKRLHIDQVVRDHNCQNWDIQNEIIESHPNDHRRLVEVNGKWRVRGLSEISRCIGNAYMKNKEPFTDASNFEAPLGHRVSLDFEEPFLSAEPEVYSRVLKDTEKFIIFGSGGFWKKITIKEAAYIVNTRPRNGIAKRLVMLAQAVAALERQKRYNDILQAPKSSHVSGRRVVADDGSRTDFHDDMTVIVVYLDKMPNGGVRPQIRSYRGHSNTVRSSDFRNLDDM